MTLGALAAALAVMWLVLGAILWTLAARVEAVGGGSRGARG